MKKDKNNDKISLKELWKNPGYKALIKLGLWLIFFVIIYLFIFINRSAYNSANNIENKINSTTTIQTKITYNKMKQLLINNEQLVIYTINDYYIEGSVKDNTLNATLEDNIDLTYKIKYDGEYLYQVKKEEEIINEELLKDIKLEYLLPSNIINLINNPKIISIKNADEKIYSYNIDESTISVYLNNDRIEKIIVLDNGITYNLEFKEVN